MNCQTIKKLLPIYSDQGLGPIQEQEVRDHLKDCPVCRKEHEALKQSWAMLGEIEEIDPEPGFVGRFWTRLAAQQPWYEKLLGALKERLFNKQLVPVLATACLLLIAGSFVLDHYSQIRRTDRVIASLSAEDLTMVENIELAENLDLIKELDLLEDLDLIASLDSSKS
jgi:hypothetical protein